MMYPSSHPHRTTSKRSDQVGTLLGPKRDVRSWQGQVVDRADRGDRDTDETGDRDRGQEQRKRKQDKNT